MGSILGHGTKIMQALWDGLNERTNAFGFAVIYMALVQFSSVHYGFGIYTWQVLEQCAQIVSSFLLINFTTMASYIFASLTTFR